jgi:tRNA (guanosine-2'-O-)-methyltransferase
MQILATHLSDKAIDFREIDYTRPTCILMGQEKTGITQEALALADQDIIIPMIGMVQSLNVSVASALILYEAQRQRQNAGMYQRANSMLPEEQQRLLFEGGYPVLARVARQKVCLTPTSTSRAKWKPMPRGGLPCRLRGKPCQAACWMPFRSVHSPVGAAQSSKLAKIGLHTVQDLLHLPLRYEDRTQLYDGDLLPGFTPPLKAKC